MKLLLSLIALLALSGCASFKSSCHSHGGMYIQNGDAEACIKMPRNALDRNQDPTR